MAQQEEEMRQNLEELQATQEESARREAEINSLLGAVDSSSLVVQTDMEGRIIEVNRKFSTTVKINRDELIGRYLKSVFIFDAQTDEFSNLLQELRLGNKVTRNEETHPENQQAYLQVHYTPILDHDGKPYKVLGIASNLTGYRILEQGIEQKDETINELDYYFNQYKSFIKEGFIVCELSPDAIITDVNENYAEITGYGATCDAYHRVRLAEDGDEPARAISVPSIHSAASGFGIQGSGFRISIYPETRGSARKAR